MLWWNACFFNAPSPLTIHRTCLIRPERTTTSTLEPCFLRQHLNGCSRDVHRTNPPSNTHIIILDVHDQSWSYNMDIAPWAFGIAVANPTIFWSFFRVKLGILRYSIAIYSRHAPNKCTSLSWSKWIQMGIHSTKKTQEWGYIISGL